MTGYTNGRLAGHKPTFGLMKDYTDHELTNFVAVIIDEYTSTPYTWSTWGHQCLDHVQAHVNGYASVYVLESDLRYSNPHVQTAQDTIERLNLIHMVEHSKLFFWGL